jgi:hypothetical protein
MRLLQEIRSAQRTLSEITTHGAPKEAMPRNAAGVSAFLRSLLSDWTEGEVRPTHRKHPKAKTGGGFGVTRSSTRGPLSKVG